MKFNLPYFAINNRSTTTAVMVLLIVWGIAVFCSISRREDPEITIRAGMLVTLWPGASAEKIEQLVTRPLETAIKEVSEVKRIVSDSRIGVSAITIALLDHIVDSDAVWTKIRAKMQRVEPTLPQGCSRPDLNSDFGEVAVMILAMYQIPIPGQDRIKRPYSMREMDDILKDLEDIIQEIPMVGKIEKFGLQKEVVYIEADARDWGQMSLQARQLARLLDTRNTIAPGGTISTADIDYSVKPSGEFLSIEQIKSVVVGSRGGAPIHLGDMNVNISRRYIEPQVTGVRFCAPDYPGRERRCDCLILSFTMRDGYNVVELGKIVREKIAEVGQTVLPPDIKVEIVNDTPRQVASVIGNFLLNLWQAIAIVLFVAFLMIGLRVSLIMAAAIPLCIISAIGCMSIFGVQLEQCSIAALIISLGMLVDNAVVISDNVLRLMEMGYTKTEAAWRGAQELLLPILTSTMTTVAAFLPMLTIAGDTGEYIRSLPIVVSTTLIISFFVAMTITPLMCHIFLQEKSAEDLKLAKRKASEAIKTGRIVDKGLVGKYGRIMRWGIRNKAIIIGVALVLFIASLFVADKLGTAFFPEALRDQFVIEIELPAGSSLAHTKRVVKQVEDILLNTSPLKTADTTAERLRNIVTYVGKGGPRFFITVNPESERPYYAQMMVNTTSKWYTRPLMQDIQKKLQQIPQARIVARTLDMGPPIKTPVALRIRGKDVDVLQNLAREIESHMEKIEGSLNVHNSWGNMSYQLAVDVDEDAANLAGITNLEIANALYGYFSGTKVTTYREGRHEIDVILRIKPKQRQNLDYLDYLYVAGKHGKLPLNAVAKIEPRWQVSLIQRRNLMRTIEVRSFVKPGYLGNNIALQTVATINDQVAIPPGYLLEIGGEYQKTGEGQDSVRTALQISMVLIIFTLIIQFNSYIKPLIILLTMPMALIGAVLGLWISGWPIGFMPLLGMVSLCGVVVNNAIVLLDFIQTLASEGMPLRMAVIRGAQFRMRPIFLTTLTTVGGFIPLAISGGPLWEGLAYVMIFGLLAATLLTLVVIPVIFIIFAENFGMQATLNKHNCDDVVMVT